MLLLYNINKCSKKRKKIISSKHQINEPFWRSHKCAKHSVESTKTRARFSQSFPLPQLSWNRYLLFWEDEIPQHVQYYMKFCRTISHPKTQLNWPRKEQLCDVKKEADSYIWFPRHPSSPLLQRQVLLGHCRIVVLL